VGERSNMSWLEETRMERVVGGREEGKAA
jgi:hypothetical protein